MLYTIIEISNLINLSKVSIYEKLKLKELEGHIIKKKDVIYIDDIGFNLIKDSFKQENLQEFTEKMKTTQDENIDYIVNMNKELIKTLIDQLKEKANQIHELHKLIDNNQATYKKRTMI